MLPEEVGAAAAYEAWRYWQTHTTLAEPLGGNLERQREALVGIAVADGMTSYHLLTTHFDIPSLSFQLTASKLFSSFCP